MKNVTLSHYTVRGIEPKPWKETWNNLTEFAERIAPKLAPMDIRLMLRQVILDDERQDNLMMGNMVTIASPEIGTAETPIENLLMLELDYSDCETCRTAGGVTFPCRTFVDFDGMARQTLPEEFFMEATLRIAFKAGGENDCSCSGCHTCGAAATRSWNNMYISMNEELTWPRSM